MEKARDVSSCESRGRRFDGEAKGRKYVGEMGDEPSSFSSDARDLSFPLSLPPPAKLVMILAGRLNRFRRVLVSLTGFVLSASLDARFRLLSNRASVADSARSRETGGPVVVVAPVVVLLAVTLVVAVVVAEGVVVVVGGVATGSSNWPPGMVPLRGLGTVQFVEEGCISVVGESSESEPSSTEEKDMRDSSMRFMVRACGDDVVNTCNSRMTIDPCRNRIWIMRDDAPT